jgi:hypothetical protein
MFARQKFGRTAALALSAALGTAFAVDGAVLELPSPAPAGSTAQALHSGPDGALVLSWVEGKAGEGQRLRFSRREDSRWSTPATAGEELELPDLPAVVPLGGRALGAGWIAMRKDSSGAAVKRVLFARSDDGSKFGAPQVASEHAAAGPYNLALATGGAGDLVGVWSDGRLGETRALVGRRLASNGRLDREIVLDDDICSCCLPQTVNVGGGLLTLYRDRLAGEVRDPAVVRWGVNGVANRQRIGREGWVLAGCPSNSGALAARGDEVVAAWFSAAGDRPRVLFARSADGGRRFDAPLEIDAASPIGFVRVAIAPDGAALVAWRGRSGGREEMRLARLDGAAGGKPVVLGAFQTESQGYPHLAVLDGRPVVAWREAEGSLRLVALEANPQTAASPHVGER